MRPIIDLNNTWSSEETVVYLSRFEIIGGGLIQILILVLFYFSIINNNYIFSILLLIPTYFLVKKIKKLFIERNEIQLTINSYGIKVKNEPIISWDNIENERIISFGKRKKTRHTFVFNDKIQNRERRFRTDILIFGFFELMKSAKIHRERFNRNNAIKDS